MLLGEGTDADLDITRTLADQLLDDPALCANKGETAKPPRLV
ncbi:hypothetical protein PPSIR1_21194 [Plesiocystis pacifica SIR-1]|uniref:Uncharacterized protein n=1 Tax=Plesiocystis pacifica SIR-1 TaxID=391625 RepID=A6G3H8_9BACT|nr:hypothetical protein PPSIR1_21194 [Plesiocystis pacifica SIR-1]